MYGLIRAFETGMPQVFEVGGNKRTFLSPPSGTGKRKLQQKNKMALTKDDIETFRKSFIKREGNKYLRKTEVQAIRLSVLRETLKELLKHPSTFQGDGYVWVDEIMKEFGVILEDDRIISKTKTGKSTKRRKKRESSSISW